MKTRIVLMKRFRKKKKESAHIELVSLIDIIFILLVFFMISSSFLRPVIRLKLPISATKEKEPKKKKIKITLSATGKLFVDKKKTTFQKLSDLLITQVEKNPKIVVIFWGDEDISYKKFIHLMDIVKKSGVKNIAISHRPKN